MIKIIDLDIDELLSGDTRIEEIALVLNPAIETEWVYMSAQEEQFESYTDYPQAASDAACKVLRWIDEHGRDEVDGMTPTGLARANQLCKREPISEETISRMASFERHRKNAEISEEYKGTPWKDKGYVAWLGWGDSAGIEWAQRKLEQIKKEKMNSQCGCSIGEDFVDSAKGISVGDYVSWTYAGRGEDADRGRGQVKQVRVEGEVNIPDTDLTLTATEEKPVALIETRDGKIVGQYIDGDMRVIQKPEGFNENQDMVEGIIDLLNQVDDMENRLKMALEVIKDFQNQGIEVDYDVFLERIGVGGPDLMLNPEEFDLDNTVELEELLEEGYVITEAREIDPEEVMKEYTSTFNKSNVSEEKFYRLTSSPNEPSILDSPYRLRRYVYSIGPQGGPDLIPTSRLFCRKMMGKRQLVWRFEDLQMLSTQLNAEDRKRTIIPRPKGARVDVFLYAGGANCRHRFLELSLDPSDKVFNNKQKAVRDATVTLDAPGLAGRVNEPVQVGRHRDPSTLRQESMSSIETPIGFLQGVPVFSTEDEAKRHSTTMGCEGVYEKVDYLDGEGFRPCRTQTMSKFSEHHFNFKLDDEKRMIYSPAMVPNKLIPRFENGERFFVRFSPESIERAAHKYLMERRVGPEFVNLEHTDTKFDDIYLVESWITTENDKLYDMGFSKEDNPVGTWAVGFKVKNDDVWENYVKKGLVRGLSVEGLFDMSFNSHKTDEYLLDEIINILNDIK